MTLEIPDPFNPGRFFVIRNPESIIRTHAAAGTHSACPICRNLKDLIEQANWRGAAAWQVPRPSVTDTQPLTVEQIREALDEDLVASGPVGFEIVEVGVKDDTDASGKIAKIEKAKGVEWVN